MDNQIVTGSTKEQSGLQGSNDTEKQDIIRNQLLLILHAQTCELPASSNFYMNTCPVVYCQMMKNVVTHMQSCCDNACKITHCTSSKRILKHWESCELLICQFCMPVKKGTISLLTRPTAQGWNQQIAGAWSQQVAASNLKPPPGFEPFPAAPAANHWAMHSSETCFPSCVPYKPFYNFQPSGLGQPVQSQLWDGSYFIERNAIEKQPLYKRNGGLAAITKGKKDWHNTITPDLRDHLVDKMVHAICPTPSQEAMKDRRMGNLVSFARKIESDLYEKAETKMEYYTLFCEKIIIYQKELEEKKRQMLEKRMWAAAATQKL